MTVCGPPMSTDGNLPAEADTRRKTLYGWRHWPEDVMCMKTSVTGLHTCPIRADPASRSNSTPTQARLAQAEVAKEPGEDATTSVSNSNQADFNGHENRSQ